MEFRWQSHAGSHVTSVTLSGSFGATGDSEAAAQALLRSGRWRDGHILLDLRDLDTVTVPSADVLGAAVERWIARFGLPRRIAVLCRPGATFGIARVMTAFLRDDQSRTALFTALEEARRWLLTPPADAPHAPRRRRAGAPRATDGRCRGSAS